MSDAVKPVPTVDALMDERADDRPEFLGELSGDKVYDAIMRLAMEVSVLRDRMDVYEQVAQSDSGDFLQRLESFESSPELEAERTSRRRQLIRRLLRDLR